MYPLTYLLLVYWLSANVFIQKQKLPGLQKLRSPTIAVWKLKNQERRQDSSSPTPKARDLGVLIVHP